MWHMFGGDVLVFEYEGQDSSAPASAQELALDVDLPILRWSLTDIYMVLRAR